MAIRGKTIDFVTQDADCVKTVEATHADGGDSGGGCFKAGDNKVLVGVIGARAVKANGEVFTVITSVHAHRDWLQRQIEEARDLPLPEAPAADGRAPGVHGMAAVGERCLA